MGAGSESVAYVRVKDVSAGSRRIGKANERNWIRVLLKVLRQDEHLGIRLCFGSRRIRDGVQHIP